MGTSLKTKKNLKMGGVAVVGAGSILLFVTGHWILGLLVLGFAVFLGIGLMKFMAGSGQRF